MFAKAYKIDFLETLSDHKLETLIAWECLLVVTCFVLVLQNCLLAQGLQHPRKQEIRLDSDPDWQCVFVVCFDHPALKMPVTELEDPALGRSSLASSDRVKVPFVVAEIRRLVC